MASASVQVKYKTAKKHEQAAFKVMGLLSRRIGLILATEGSTGSACLQVYFNDPEFQAKYRALGSSTSAIKQREVELLLFIWSCQRWGAWVLDLLRSNPSTLSAPLFLFDTFSWLIVIQREI